MNFNQHGNLHERDQQAEHYFLQNQQRWYTGTHDLVAERHPVHSQTLDDHFFTPGIDAPDSSDAASLDSFFTDKLDVQRLHVSGLASQIRRRNAIKDENLSRIDLDMVKCQSVLLELEHIPKVFDPTIARTRNTFEKELLTLEKEKRAEYVSWWRDLVLVKRDLITAFKEFTSAEKRVDLISGLDAPFHPAGSYLIPHNDYTR